MFCSTFELFLSNCQIFYALGEDLSSSDAHKNNYLHMCARKGDASEATLRCLLDLKFRGGRRVFHSKAANIQGQLAFMLQLQLQ